MDLINPFFCVSNAIFDSKIQMLKRDGLNAKKIFEIAQSLTINILDQFCLLSSKVYEITHQLGFEYSQSFSKLFKTRIMFPHQLSDNRLIN